MSLLKPLVFLFAGLCLAQLPEDEFLTHSLSRNLQDTDTLQSRLKAEFGADKPKRVILPDDKPNG